MSLHLRLAPCPPNPYQPVCPRMSVDHNPDTDTAEFIERCEAFLSAAHDLVLVHIESSRTTTHGLSPRDQAFTLQQRTQFLDHLHVSVGHLESLIEHQEALAAIFHGRHINPHTGLPIFYIAEIPTAHRVPLDCSAETVQPPRLHAVPRGHTTGVFHYAVRRGRTTGVFQSWEAVHEQVDGFPNNQSGYNINDAWADVNDIHSTTTVSPYIQIMSLIVLQPPLTDDAHSRIHYSNWKKSLATVAQSLCRTLDDCGAYSIVAEDPDWESHPSNIISTTSAAGVTIITIRARPIITKPTIYTAKRKEDSCH